MWERRMFFLNQSVLSWIHISPGIRTILSKVIHRQLSICPNCCGAD